MKFIFIRFFPPPETVGPRKDCVYIVQPCPLAFSLMAGIEQSSKHFED